MKEIISTNVLVQNRFTMKKMLEIYQGSKQFEGTTYLYSKHKAVDASNLSKLVSFLLTVKPQTTLKIIVEGNEVQNHLEHIKEMCSNHVSVLHMSEKRLINSAETFQL
ncbi:HPr family phosphocarrier protein [Bacillus sp. CMF12]|uniref:HPr family phosphocarrier protein n=1 Tax=Bacillaceae TaxID=186817 RepID=UPI001FB479D8|nr:MULTISPECIES: HPr family phosphocarrier protein [Bacillaceae]MDF2039114.1 HPr family phosphocarrier protein [Cytobacillus oceanisediminis]UOE56602.1 HPr family phosphocarrier protein [Cytobacillus oceanisediminis]USK51092.1 HPr family phosphocarrier protein [Bacillus sp. CMF12]